MMRYGFDLGLLFLKVGSLPEELHGYPVIDQGMGVTSTTTSEVGVTPRFAWQMLIISRAL